MNLVSDVKETELAGIHIQVDKTGDVPVLIKAAVTDMEKAFLRNEARILQHLRPFGIAPRLVEKVDPISSEALTLTESYLGTSEPVVNEVKFRRNCALLLRVLHNANVIHGDLTRKNIIVRQDFPFVVDWHQSRFTAEPGPDKRPEGDAYHLWRAAIELSPDTSRHLRKWCAIRPYVQDGDILDLGCAEGDYLLFAFAENPNRKLWGVDHHRESVIQANFFLTRAGMDKKVVEHLQLIEQYNVSYTVDTIFLMSVYPYLAEDYGRIRADEFVRNAITKSKQLFFETQLYGDGPGRLWHLTDGDVYSWLKGMGGRPEKVVTIPVHGRQFDRTVWRVT